MEKKKSHGKSEIIETNKGSNISLYLGASAFFISIVSAILLYRELSKMKENFSEVKRMKNQLINIDSKFEDVDDQLKKVLNAVSGNVIIKPIKPIETEKNVVFLDDDIDGNSEISYEDN